jgi:hypothetical protein
VIDALRRFAGSCRISASTRSALESVLRCRTAALGGHRYECDCGYIAVVYNSCGNRHCPQCQGPRRYRWLEAQQKLLLPVPHFQVVFTLPAELRPVARQFPKAVYDLLFRAADHALKRLAATRWGAMPGILAVLHTWARDLSFHPHVHCVVSAGGLTDDDGWVASRPDYLFATRALQAVFRGFFLAELRRLDLPLDLDQRIALRNARRKIARKGWVVHVERPEGRDPVLMLKYLARYVYQTALSDHRMVEITADTVTFRTRDTKTHTLAGAEFVRRFAQHVLPKGFRKVRHSGLLAPGRRNRLAAARDLIEHLPTRSPAHDLVPAVPSEPVATIVPTPRDRCPECGAPLRVHVIARPPLPVPSARGPP